MHAITPFTPASIVTFFRRSMHIHPLVLGVNGAVVGPTMSSISTALAATTAIGSSLTVRTIAIRGYRLPTEGRKRVSRHSGLADMPRRDTVHHHTDTIGGGRAPTGGRKRVSRNSGLANLPRRVIVHHHTDTVGDERTRTGGRVRIHMRQKSTATRCKPPNRAYTASPKPNTTVGEPGRDMIGAFRS